MRRIVKFANLIRRLTTITKPSNGGEVEVLISDFAENLGQNSFAILLKKNKKLEALEIRDQTISSPQVFLKHYPKLNQNLVSSKDIDQIIPKFDSDSWSKFAEELDPVISANLDIAKNPQSINRYNLCIPEESLSEPEYSRAKRNRSKALHHFPLLSRIAKESPEEGQKLIESFDKGSSSKPTELVKTHLQIPLADRLFAKRLGHFIHPFLVKHFYNFIFSGLLDANGSLNKKSYEAIISKTPLPAEKEEYQAMLSIVSNLTDGWLDEAKKIKLFRSINRGQWTANYKALGDNFKNELDAYSKAIALDLILPAYIEKIDEKLAQISDSQPVLKKYDHWFTRHVLENLTTFVKDHLVSNYSPKKIANFITEHSKRAAQINEARPLFLERAAKFREENYQSYPQWYKAFEDQEIGGFKFRCLVNESELSQESKIMHHCGSNYGHRALFGSRHIVSATSTSGEKFTLRFDSKDSKITLGEIVTTKKYLGPRSLLSTEADAAVKSLCQKIESKEIELSPQFGSIDKKSSVADVIGFEPNKENSEKLFKAHLDSHSLPSSQKTLEKFKEEIGLDNFLDKILERDIALSKSATPPTHIQKAEASRLHDRGPREIVFVCD